MIKSPGMFCNLDCVRGARKYLKNDSVDLIVTGPSFEIEGIRF